MKGINFSHLRTWILFPVLLIVPFIVSSCQDDTEEQWGTDSLNPEKEFVISGHIEQECNTRATDLGFVDGDKMGVFIVDYAQGQPGKIAVTGNRTSNMCYKYKAGENKWIPTKNVYWKDDKTPVDVYGYYPFKEVVSSVDSYEFIVNFDQGEPGAEGQLGGYEASDFLWAKSVCVSPNTPVMLEYRHQMAGVKVILKEGTGFAAGEWGGLSKLVTVDNTIRKAQINLSTGTVTPAGAFDKNILMAAETAGYRAVVVPQTIKAGKSLIGITIDGISYPFKMSKDMLYQSGLLHQFTIEVNKRTSSGDYELKLMDEQITPWVNDELSHNFEGNSYVVVNVEKEGTLKQCLEKAHIDFTSLKNLKIIGKLTNEDFDFMRANLSSLASINLQRVKLVNVRIANFENGDWVTIAKEDVLPPGAFDRFQSLRRIILPDGLKEIGDNALAHLRLTSFLAIPNTVTHIHGGAMDSSDLSTELPRSLVYIGGMAFYGANVNMELNIPNSVEIIGSYAFRGTRGLHGTFALPASLKELGEYAFSDCRGPLDGIIEIPQSITEIPSNAFGIEFKKGTILKLHDGVRRIGDAAFVGLRLNAPIYLNPNIEYIGPGAFKYSHFRGGVELPANLRFLGHEVFTECRLDGKIVIPDHLNALAGSPDGIFESCGIEELITGKNLEQIEEEVFRGCGQLRRVFLEENISYIGDYAFADCGSLQLFVCLAEEPPVLGRGTFENIQNNPMAILEVPEKSLSAYRNAPGWNQFRYISAYHELACTLSTITCLNKGMEREGILRTEGPWYVKSCPSWCSVDVTSGDGVERKTLIKVKVSPLAKGAASREDRIVFALKDKEYTTDIVVKQFDSDVIEDSEIVLQQASVNGKEIPIFLLGDGFNAEDIKNGQYLEIMKQQMEHLFAIEPFKTYRNHFTVTTAVALSPMRGLGTGGQIGDTKFETYDNWGAFSSNADLIKDYVLRVSKHVNNQNLDKSTIVMMCNVQGFSGNTWRDDYSGMSIVYCSLSEETYPYDQRGLIQYHVGGVGFGRLGPENVNHYEFIQACPCPGCNALNDFHEAKQKGEMENLSLSGKMNDVPWRHLIFHPKYSGIVDLYEGGYNHARGVFRSEVNSCMNTFIPYYNTISRESIVKRIMKYSGKTFDFEDFVKNDKIEIPNN